MSEGQSTAAAPATTTQGTERNNGTRPGSAPKNSAPSAVPGGAGTSPQSSSGSTPVSKEGNQSTEEILNNKFKVKVYGREREMDYSNPDDRKEIQRRLQMDVAAEQRMQQAAALEKKYQQIAESGQKDPDQFLKAFGHDPLEYAKKVIAEQIKREMMNPHERQLVTEKQQREAAEKQLRDINEQNQKQYETQLRTQKQQQWEGNILKALETTKDLPVAPVTVRLMAQNLLDAKQNGFEMTPEEAAHVTKDQMVGLIGEVLEKMTPQQIVKNFGQAFVDKIKNHAIEELRSPLKQPYGRQQTDKSNFQTEDAPRKWKSWNEVRNVWDKRSKT